MVFELLEAGLESFETLFALLALFLSYRIYKFNRLSKGWIGVVIGFLLLSIGSAVDATEEIWTSGTLPMLQMLEMTGDVLIFTGRLTLLIGLWSMLKSFESFDVVQSNARDKAKKFSDSFISGVRGGE